MPQRHMTIYRFRRDADPNRLAQAVAKADGSGMVSSDGRSLFKQVFTGNQVEIHYWCSEGEMRRAIEDAGYRMRGKIPRPFIEIKIAKNGGKQDKNGLKIGLVKLGRPYSFMMDDSTVYVHEDFAEEAITLIQRSGYRVKSHKQDL